MLTKDIAGIVVLLMVSLISVSAQSGIRAVDFKNFTYSAHCIEDAPVNYTVKGGEYSYEKQEDGYVDRLYFTVTDIAFGDLNGDKNDEAIVLTVCNTGGTGNFSEGFVFGMKAGKPSLIARIPGGDRGYGGLRETRVENGLLVVESNDAGENGAACCPEFIVTTKYKLTAGKLVRSGPETRREVVPNKRVTFAKGTTGSTLKVKIPAGEAVRYIVGARGGQRLAVSVSSDSAALRLIEEAQVTEGINNFLAILQNNGDYTIEIENTSDADIEVTVNIKIT